MLIKNKIEEKPLYILVLRVIHINVSRDRPRPGWNKMQRHRQVLSLIIGFVLFSACVMAADYQISVTPINTSTLPNESATFNVTITNFDRISERFQIYTLDTRWVLNLNPVLYQVDPETIQSTTLSVHPTTDVGYGTQGLTLLVKHLDDNIIYQESLILYVINPNYVPEGYVPSVALDDSFPESINPRNPLDITISLRNRNALNFTSLTIDLNSPLFTRTLTQSLEPLAEQSEETTFTLNPDQAAGDYNLTVTLIAQNKTINEVTKTLHIAAITDVAATPQETDELFRETTSVTLTNNGNVVTTYTERLPTNWLRALFSSTTPTTSTQVSAGVRYHVWSITLAPQETATVTRVENYRLPAIVLILIIIGVATYFAFRSPLIAVKEAISLKEAGEEGSSTTKVRIFVKNRTGKQLSGVNVIDRVPSLATYKPQASLGSVSPTKVVTSPKGTMLKWELDLLEPYEERILSYGLHSQLKILGKMTLPPAKVKFSTKNGERATYTRTSVYEE